jgi:hypothetical protein
MGDQATELIAELNLARRLEATTEELICTMHAHPTMHEALHEAALASEGRVINDEPRARARGPTRLGTRAHPLIHTQAEPLRSPSRECRMPRPSSMP